MHNDCEIRRGDLGYDRTRRASHSGRPVHYNMMPILSSQPPPAPRRKRRPLGVAARSSRPCAQDTCFNPVLKTAATTVATASAWCDVHPGVSPLRHPEEALAIYYELFVFILRLAREGGREGQQINEAICMHLVSEDTPYLANRL